MTHQRISWAAIVPVLHACLALGMGQGYDPSGACTAMDEEPSSHYQILNPRVGDVYRVGDSISFEFCSEDTYTYLLEQAVYHISYDSGASWIPIVFPTPAKTPGTLIAIPDTVADNIREIRFSPVSRNVFVRIIDYNDGDDLIISGPFRIEAPEPASIMEKPHRISLWTNAPASPPTDILGRRPKFDRSFGNFNIILNQITK